MKLIIHSFALMLLFSAASILSMDAISKETRALEGIVIEYSKTQNPDQRFWAEWYTATTNNLSLIFSLAQRGQTEYLGFAIKSLVCLPVQYDSHAQTLNLSIGNYKHKTLEMIKEHQNILYKRAQVEASAQRFKDQLRSEGQRPLSDYVYQRPQSDYGY